MTSVDGYSSKSKPFLKWAGGKFKLAPTIIPLFDYQNKSVLIEPFLGAGSIFLNSPFTSYQLSDVNPDLINLFTLIQHEGDSFIEFSKQFFTVDNNSETAFYAHRDLFNTTSDTRLKSALFIYLNKHCFNGLCRYNRKGEFNVPFGRYSSIQFPDSELKSFYLKSKRATFTSQRFEAALSSANSDSVVYCDPPYAPLADKDGFTNYSGTEFTKEDQVTLATMARAAALRGAQVIISNHDTPFTRELYEGANILTIDVARNIGSQSASRIKVKELIAVFNPSP